MVHVIPGARHAGAYQREQSASEFLKLLQDLTPMKQSNKQEQVMCMFYRDSGEEVCLIRKGTHVVIGALRAEAKFETVRACKIPRCC